MELYVNNDLRSTHTPVTGLSSITTPVINRHAGRQPNDLFAFIVLFLLICLHLQYPEGD